MSTTLEAELLQAAEDADASAIAYAVYAGKVHDAPRKRAVFEERAARLRQRAAWVRELGAKATKADCLGCCACDDLRTIRALTGPIPATTPLPVPACGATYCSDGNAGGHGGAEFSECGRPRGHEGPTGDLPGTRERKRRPQPGDGPVTAPTERKEP